MQTDVVALRKALSEDLTTVLIRFALIAFVVFVSVKVFAPFASIMLWALVLAIALHPLQLKLQKRLGGPPGRSATVLVLGALLLIGVPTVLLGSSFAKQIFDTYDAFNQGTVVIPQPVPSVAEWPLVGGKLYETWQAAAADLPAFLETLQPQLANFTKWVLGVAASTAGGVFLLLGALIIAGIMLAYAGPASEAMRRVFNRIAGANEGAALQKLTTATVRSVATGVIGVAFIQALLLGIVFLVAGVPGAGIWALIALLLGIMQLPATLISLPVIAYLWLGTDGSTLYNAIFTVLLIVAGLADNVLKPMLLGRGVDAPMPVVLLGALGGMISGGILGMFIGAAFLAAGYRVFMEWVAAGNVEANADIGPQTAS